jgi:hypothetical protein
MTRSTMRRGVREALADVELYLPFPWSIEELTERLGTQRAKPIRLVAWAFPAEPDAPTGLWVATDQADYVFYDSDASPARREQIIGHELGHLLLGHTPRLSEAFDGLIEALAPSVSRELARPWPAPATPRPTRPPPSCSAPASSAPRTPSAGRPTAGSWGG